MDVNDPSSDEQRTDTWKKERTTESLFTWERVES